MMETCKWKFNVVLWCKLAATHFISFRNSTIVRTEAYFKLAPILEILNSIVSDGIK